MPWKYHSVGPPGGKERGGLFRASNREVKSVETDQREVPPMEWRIESMYPCILHGALLARSSRPESRKAQSLWSLEIGPRRRLMVYFYTPLDNLHTETDVTMYTLEPLGQGLFGHICILPSTGAFFLKFCFDADVAPVQGRFPARLVIPSKGKKAKRQKGVYPVPFPTASFLLFPRIATMLVTCVLGAGRAFFRPGPPFAAFSPFRCEARSAVSHRTAGYGQTRTRDRSWSVFLGASQTVPSFPPCLAGQRQCRFWKDKKDVSAPPSLTRHVDRHG
jgi:hypothetical protein